jgi:rhodanese-related sulfurtransferase
MPSSRRAFASDVEQISPRELAAWLGDPGREKPVLIDVREPWEHDKARIEGAVLIPMREVPARIAEIPGSREVVALCHHGGRSMQVALFLEKQGFKRVHNLAGGIDAWSRTVDPAVPLY